MIVKSWVILGTLAMSFYIAFFGTTSFAVSFTPAVAVMTHLHRWTSSRCPVISGP